MHDVSHETPGFVSKKLPELEFWFHHQNQLKNVTKNGFPPETSSTLGGKARFHKRHPHFELATGRRTTNKIKRDKTSSQNVFPPFDPATRKGSSRSLRAWQPPKGAQETPKSAKKEPKRAPKQSPDHLRIENVDFSKIELPPRRELDFRGSEGHLGS